MKRNVYLYKSGELKRKDNTLAYINKNSTVYIPIHQIDHILVFGECKMNKKLLEYLNRFNITISFFSRYGHFIGRYVPNKNRNVDSIISQVEAYQNIKRRNRIALSIEKGNIRNEISLCKYLKEKRKLTIDEVIINNLESKLKELENLERTTNNYVNRAMLIEAQAKKEYYKLFDCLINDNDFRFEKRISNPPGNYLNAMMSFGYSLLYSELLSAIDQSSLIPEVSFIHGHTHHKEGSLHYDLADIFKPYLIDRMCIKLILENRINKNHFYKTVNCGCFLNEEGRKIFTAYYDTQLNKTMTDIRNGKSYSFKQMMKREIEVLERALKENTKYTTFYYKW